MESMRTDSRKAVKPAGKPAYFQAPKAHVWRTIMCAHGQKG